MDALLLWTLAMATEPCVQEQKHSITTVCNTAPLFASLTQYVICGAAWCAGYAIAFIYNRKLTLVMTASVPLIALAAIMQVGHACLQVDT